MKKLILALSLCFAVCSIGAFAQQNQKPCSSKCMSQKENRSGWLKKMQKELSLSDEQVNQLQAIDDKYNDKEDDIDKESKKNRRDQKTELREEKMQEVKTVLTKDQLKKWEKIQADKTFKKKGKN